MDLLTRLLGLYMLIDIIRYIAKLSVQLLTLRIKERIPVPIFRQNDR
ncbi:hypothetical protein [Rhodohalobacter halophilus]|nr:hypothetical protein [Rhodohalobacter halophilus]